MDSYASYCAIANVDRSKYEVRRMVGELRGISEVPTIKIRYQSCLPNYVRM